MLSRPFYESLPYLCMIAAATTLFWQRTPLTISAGLVLFFAGAKIYIMRSDNRRTDPSRKRKKGSWPKSLYELFPFLCLALSAMLLGMPDASWMILPSLAMMAYSLYVLASRANYRHHQIPSPRGNR
ncbi:hypothetical protein KJI95_08295 [Shewanella sp. JM162201]|uniref:Inner membrane protein n=1 Tax=Shewanella jiangmenensis TaxID=2837387 RepID=A0ABS5V240_9GAMM|nr:hypothetical protein [Shewanella jiangmenensis]MBT1444528.1 hypothetical protein [Shewanella jiangmenensis]